MFLIKEITSNPKQRHTPILADGSQLFLTIEYKPQQFGWFITQLKYNDFILNNVRITTSPNLLHQFHNQLTFGLGCFVQANEEPTLQEDFSSGRSKLYILSNEEKNLFEDILDGKTTA